MRRGSPIFLAIPTPQWGELCLARGVVADSLFSPSFGKFSWINIFSFAECTEDISGDYVFNDLSPVLPAFCMWVCMVPRAAMLSTWGLPPCFWTKLMPVVLRLRCGWSPWRNLKNPAVWQTDCFVLMWMTWVRSEGRQDTCSLWRFFADGF